jgi:prolipoprotein diacylglyceryltransferase
MTVLLSIVFFIFWVWMLIDCAHNETVEDNQRTVWLIIIIVTFVIGAAIYYFTRKMPRDKLSS